MSTSFDFDSLPDNVLTLSGYDFFQFIKTTLGEPEANLLKKISVKSTLSFLVNEDPFDIFKYDIEDNELEALKAQLSFKLKNETFMLKPGILAGFKSLREALKRKSNEQSTQTKKKRKRLFIMNSSSTPLSLAERESKGNNSLSVVEHRSHVIKLLEKWCLTNKENFGLEDFHLKENVDYTLHIELDKNDEGTASVKCTCGRLISLAKNESKIQLSNYYKHLQSTSCDHMKKIKKAAKDLVAMQQQQQPVLSPLSRSNLRLLDDTDIQPIGVNAVTASAPAPLSSELSNESGQKANKRHLPSNSQKYPSAKRSRA